VIIVTVAKTYTARGIRRAVVIALIFDFWKINMIVVVIVVISIVVFFVIYLPQTRSVVAGFFAIFRSDDLSPFGVCWI
jgi:hypothetical protein